MADLAGLPIRGYAFGVKQLELTYVLSRDLRKITAFSTPAIVMMTYENWVKNLSI